MLGAPETHLEPYRIALQRSRYDLYPLLHLAFLRIQAKGGAHGLRPQSDQDRRKFLRMLFVSPLLASHGYFIFGAGA
jgi:hypothetical protein